MINADEILTVTVGDGTRFRVKRIGKGPRVLFSHGAGFAVDAYAPFVHELARHVEVVAFDLRGHGAGPRVSVEDYELAQHIDDIADIAGALKPPSGGLHGAFHSISGVFALGAQRAASDSFRSLALFEPPLGRVGDGEQWFVDDKMGRAARAAKRRDRFDSTAELAARFEGLLRSEARARIVAEALLVQDGSDNYTLRCPRDIESKTYATNQSFGLWDALPGMNCPGTILAGNPGESIEYPGSVAADIANAAGFEYQQVSGIGHLGLLEAPSRTARLAVASIRKHS